MKLSHIQTKIVTTLGPATADSDMVVKLIDQGVTVFRLNFAHGDYAEHARHVKRVRQAAKTAQTPIGVLQDLPGPKLRVDRLPKGELGIKRDDIVTLRSNLKRVYARTIPIDYPNLSKELKKGDRVFISDGVIRLVVQKIRGEDVICQVTHGGIVRNGNGINMPNSSLSLKAFTKEDEKHLAFGLKQKIDFVGISFVGRANDIHRVRQFCRRRGADPFIIAKIERQQALKNLDEIIEAADGIMVARGDLGVEIHFSDIPAVQKDIVERAHQKGKPVILATQVLESMIQNARPTRAEATDIANAILEGADAIMLSGETSVGQYPEETIKALGKVISATEKRKIQPDFDLETATITQSDIIAHEACQVAERVGADMIVVPTQTGGTAARVSRFRPSMPVLAIVSDRRLRRRFSLYHGIQTIPIDKPPNFTNAFSVIRSYLLKKKIAKKGQTILVISGAPGLEKGQTGMIQLVSI